MAISGLNINFIFWLLFFRKCVIMLFVLYVCKFPGVAQLVGRLVWDQDAASSSLATRTIKAERAFALSAFIF